MSKYAYRFAATVDEGLPRRWQAAAERKQSLQQGATTTGFQQTWSTK
jgi:hypothetical protein